MSESHSLRELYQALRKDADFRTKRPFSGDIQAVNELLFDTYAKDHERQEHLSNWLQGHGHQPCLFGRVAAAMNALHFCVLTEVDILSKGDADIAREIHDRLLDWKKRSLRPTNDFSDPAFGFVLLAASPHLANAAPDDHLHAFANKLRDLWGPQQTQEPSGPMDWETLYLRHPQTGHYVRFTFSVDFFAAQGDGRWWHDHRCPGGLMFTANSVGHMQRYREWYSNMRGQTEWVLQTAMLTIDEAATTSYGKATWLRKLGPGDKPIAENLACPLKSPKPQLQGKDWTKYAGWLHTDHSIRPEFFHEDPSPSPEVANREYLQDFTYLYTPGAKDHTRFVQGENVSPEEVTQKLGPIEDWQSVFRKTSGRIRIQTFDSAMEPEPEDAAQHRRNIQRLLEVGRGWRMSTAEINSVSGT